MLLDTYLPDYFRREVHHLAVSTSPEETYRAFCNFDMARIPWIDALFRIRTLLDKNNGGVFTLTLRDAYAPQSGFTLLQEVPDKELVVGAAGKIWRPAMSFKKLQPQEYKHFHESGFGKVAWSLRCESRIVGGTLVTFELRVGATDSISAAKMRSYYSVIGPFSRAIRRAVNRRIARQLGDLYADEGIRALPGDEIISSPEGSFTDAITIEAPPEAIWPWLVQMGCLRGGWYSYDWLDNASVHSASRIVKDWQDIKEGDVFNATPSGDGGFHVVTVRPFRTLILGGCFNLETSESFRPDIAELPKQYFRSTWTFVLQPETDRVTRLVVRARGDYSEAGISQTLRAVAIRPIHTLMERKQLRNLKRRAENLFQENALSLSS